MSYWEGLDDQLRWLEPSDLNLEYEGVSHLDCVSRVSVQTTLCDGASLLEIGLKCLHQLSNFVLNILTLSCNV